MSDDEPTVNDVWPNPDDMPEEMKQLLETMHSRAEKQLDEVESNATHPAKSWWQVDKSKAGVVERVWVNKPTGDARGLWTFGKTIDDSGQPIFEITKALHVDGTVAVPVASWDCPSDLPYGEMVAELASFVGLRTARAVLKRFGAVSPK